MGKPSAQSTAGVDDMELNVKMRVCKTYGSALVVLSSSLSLRTARGGTGLDVVDLVVRCGRVLGVLGDLVEDA